MGSEDGFKKEEGKRRKKHLLRMIEKLKVESVVYYVSEWNVE